MGKAEGFKIKAQGQRGLVSQVAPVQTRRRSRMKVGNHLVQPEVLDPTPILHHPPLPHCLRLSQSEQLLIISTSENHLLPSHKNPIKA